MLISGMPELSTHEDIMYVVETLSMDKDKDDVMDFHELIEATGGQMSTRMNFFIHNLVH